MLSAKTGETAHLAVRDGRHALFIDHHVATGQVLTVSGQTGELVPLHATAHGKALLASLAADDLQELFGKTPLEGHTKRTIVTIEDLAKNAARDLQRGYSTDDGEFIEGLRCVAAPVRDQDGAVVASIGISAPTLRFSKSRYAAAGRQISRIAKAISASLKV